MIVFRCIIFMLFASVHQCRLPDKVFCVNDQCSEPISKAKTILNYNSGDPDLMSFRSNSEATIFMKSAGTNADLWFASINGHSGFVSSNFLRENKIYVKNPQVIKPVEDRRTPPPNVEPNKVQQTHEVIEGTTIYTTEATPSIPPQETLPEVTQQSVNENATPSLDTLNQENITPQPHAIGTVETPYEISQNIETQVNNVNEQRNIQNQLPVVHRQEVAANNIENQQVPPPQKMVTNNEVKSVEAPTQIIQQESPPQKAINNNVDQAQFNEGPKLEIVQPPPALLPTSGNSVSPVTTVDVSDKANFIPESATQPEAPENEHNISANNIENQQVPPPQKMVTNNEVKSVEAPTQIIQLESPPQEAINNNVDQAQFNEGPKLEIVPPPPALLPTSGNSMNPVTTVDVSDKANLIPESATQPEAPENEQNISFISNNNVENTAANDISSETNQVPEINVVASNKQPDAAPLLDQVPDLLQHDNGEASTTLSVEHPPESVDEEYTVQPEILQEDLKDDEYTTQILDYPSTTEPPVTTQYDYDTTTQSFYYNSEETTPAPNEISSANQYEIYEHTTTYEAMRETINTFSSTESPTEQLQYESTASKEATNPTTESTPDENTGGFFSNIYSTVSDMWPSATEGPPTIDDIFNREKYSEPLLKEDLDTILDSIKEPENPNHIYHSDTKEPQENEVPVKNVESEEEFSFLTYFTSVFVSVLGNGEESRALFATPGETCYTNESPHEGKEQNRRLLTFLMTTAGALLLFTLGYYYIDAKRQDSKFVGMVNSLQRELLCATKECEILKEELTTTKTKLAGIEDNSFGMDDMVQSLKEEIQELLAQNERLRNSLDDNEKLLRVSENTAGELQNTLGEVENTLSELWAERAQSEEQIAELNGKIQAFEEELISVSRDRDHFQLKYVSAETALEEAKKQAGKLDELGQKLADANNTVELQKHEITALKDALKEFNQGSFNVDVSSLIDHTEIKAKLAKASEERNALELKFKTEYKERTRLQEELQSTQETLHTTSQQANEAATRLEVLEKYFQERESELVKELNTKESLWLSKQGESASTVQKIELLQQEMQRYKEKCDALTLELAEQESAKRTAVAELEARAHSAWLEARAAKRDAAADREAAAALRRKLASLAPDGKPETQRIASPLEAAMPNGSGAALPLPLPLPLAFLPPPPLLPPLPRPPPLGGLPSPHPPRFSDRYSPDSRYSPESRYSPDSRYSQEPLRRRDSPDSRYSPERRRRSPAFSPRTHRRRTPSRERYPHPQERSSRQRNGPMMDTETEYGSDSPTRSPPRRRHSYRHSGPSSGSGCSSESDK